MADAGFHNVTAAEEGALAPSLPSGQSIVAGLSDGTVRVFEDEDSLQEKQLSAPKQAIARDFMQAMAKLPIRCPPLDIPPLRNEIQFCMRALQPHPGDIA